MKLAKRVCNTCVHGSKINGSSGAISISGAPHHCVRAHCFGTSGKCLFPVPRGRQSLGPGLARGPG